MAKCQVLQIHTHNSQSTGDVLRERLVFHLPVRPFTIRSKQVHANANGKTYPRTREYETPTPFCVSTPNMTSPSPARIPDLLSPTLALPQPPLAFKNLPS